MTSTLVAPKAHSYSRLQVFTQCPLSYKLTFMDKVPQDSSDALEIGSAAHEFFEMWVKDKKVRDAGLATDSMENAVHIMAASAFQSQARNQSNFKEFLEICLTFAKAYKPDPNYPVSKPELAVAFDRQWKRIPDWFSKDVMFRAKIDRIDEPDSRNGDPIKKIRIVDYKTGYAGTMDGFQLDVYALVGKLVYPYLEEVEVEFYYVKSGFKQVKLLRVEDLDITKIQIEALMARIEGETKWKAKPGSRCLTCPVAHACTETPSDLIKIDSLDVAKKLADEIAFLEAQAKAKKKGLNAWCKQQGPVESGGLVWNHYPIESMVIPMGPLFNICVAHNVDPATILNPDSRAIKKAIRDNPGFGEAISPYVGVDVSTRFYGKKAAGDDE